MRPSGSQIQALLEIAHGPEITRWTELVATMATKKDPEKLRLVCEEIGRISERQESESRRRMHREQHHPLVVLEGHLCEMPLKSSRN
jgi:hypothetical protein